MLEFPPLVPKVAQPVKIILNRNQVITTKIIGRCCYQYPGIDDYLRIDFYINCLISGTQKITTVFKINGKSELSKIYFLHYDFYSKEVKVFPLEYAPPAHLGETLNRIVRIVFENNSICETIIIGINETENILYLPFGSLSLKPHFTAFLVKEKCLELNQNKKIKSIAIID